MEEIERNVSQEDFWQNQDAATTILKERTSLNNELERWQRVEDELEEITAYFSGREIPLLIPGVGSQGGSVSDVMVILKKTDYTVPLVRINVSSGITHPWAKSGNRIPENWKQLCVDNLEKLNDETGSFV